MANSPNIPATIPAAINLAVTALKAAAIAAPRQEARWLMAAHLGCDLSALWLRDDTLPNATLFAQRLAARVQHQPLSRIFGRKHFWQAEFIVSPAVLDPRSDSEWLIETAVRHCSKPPQRILDLGTGSGCLLLSALAEFPHSIGIGIDASPEALQIAQQNAERLGLQERSSFYCQNWLDQWQGAPCDLILLNPPYIPANHILPKAVQDFDPHHALFAEHNGLADYMHILPQLPPLLHPHSLVVCECAPEQTFALAQLAIQNSLRVFSPLDAARHNPLHPPKQIGLVVLAHRGLP